MAKLCVRVLGWIFYLFIYACFAAIFPCSFLNDSPNSSVASNDGKGEQGPTQARKKLSTCATPHFAAAFNVVPSKPRHSVARMPPLTHTHTLAAQPTRTIAFYRKLFINSLKCISSSLVSPLIRRVVGFCHPRTLHGMLCQPRTHVHISLCYGRLRQRKLSFF